MVEANVATTTPTLDENAVEQKEPLSDSIVTRLSHLPVVALTLARLNEAYQQTKQRHELLKLALEKGEETVWTSFELAQGIATKTGLQGPLNYADASACMLLDKVEEKLPIITKTPEEIVNDTKRLYDDTVRPRIDQLNTMKDNTVQKYNDAKTYGSNKLAEAKELGTNTVKTVLNAPVNTVNNTVGWGISTADSLVDRLLPENGLSAASTDVSVVHGTGNVDQMKAVSEKLRTRLSARIADNVQTAQLLAQAMQLVDALKNTSAVTSLNQLWEQVNRLSDVKPLGDVTLASVEAQTLTLVKNLTAQLKDALEGSRQQLTKYLPQPLTDKVHQVTDTAKDIFNQVSEARNVDDLSHSLIERVNGYVESVNGTMNSALDALSETYLLKWLVPEYHHIGSLDIHMH